MPTNYTPNAANNPATITVPSDADGAMAESVNVAFRALGDKAAYAIATRAALAAVNSFTRGQTIDPTSEAEPTISCNRFPGQLTTDNRWALIFEFNIEANSSVRMYTGGLTGLGRIAWTINARWFVDDQEWRLERDDEHAAAVIWGVHGFTYHYVSSGTSPFLSWPTASVGNEGNIKAVGEFRYAQSKTRVRTIPTASCVGLYSIDGANGSVGTETIGDHSFIRWPIRIPPGAVLQKISVLHHISSSATEEFRLTRRRPTWDTGSPEVAPETELASQTSDSSTGDHITIITTSQSVDRYDELNLVWVPSGGLGNNVHAISIEWADQGPTPL